MPTSSIINNREGNTLLSSLAAMSSGAAELRILLQQTFSSGGAGLMLPNKRCHSQSPVCFVIRPICRLGSRNTRQWNRL